MPLVLDVFPWVFVSAVFGVPVGRWVWVRLVPTDVGAGTVRTYRGVYHAHWEVGNFVFDTGRRFLGVWPVRERWCLRFPEGYELPWSVRFGGRPAGRVTGRTFELEFTGVAGGRGRFGHMGIMDREVVVERVLSAVEVRFKGRVL